MNVGAMTEMGLHRKSTWPPILEISCNKKNLNIQCTICKAYCKQNLDNKSFLH